MVGGIREILGFQADGGILAVRCAILAGGGGLEEVGSIQLHAGLGGAADYPRRAGNNVLRHIEHRHSDSKGVGNEIHRYPRLEKPLKELGARIYKIPTRQSNKKSCIAMMNKVILDGQYDVVHSHRGPQGYYFLSCAKRCGVKVRIIHSHLAQPNVKLIRRIKNDVLLQADKLVATDLFACGNAAGSAMWGEQNIKNGRVHIMTNAIDADKFTFSNETRQKKRKELGLTDEFTIGIVGRIEEQKNYPFLLKIFAEILKKEPKAVLLIAGRGTEKAEKVGRDQGCIAFPDGDEMGLETGGTYHCASQIQKDSSSCGRLLCF